MPRSGRRGAAPKRCGLYSPQESVSLRKLRDSYGTYRVDSDLDLAGALRAQIGFAGALRAQLWLSSGITRHCLPDHAHVPWHILAP